MPTLNPHTRELSFKLVFYGPGLGGKTTTLKTLFAATKPERRGKLVSVATQQDRTLHFDYLPMRVGRVRGMTVRLQLYTVPGQLYYDATRRLVLSGVDGVVFVADSQVGRLEPNQEALDDLRSNLEKLERPLAQLPHSFHWNKRDLSDLVPIDELERRFNPEGAPSLGTVATSGEGVFAGLERITGLVLRAYEQSAPDSGAAREAARALRTLAADPASGLVASVEPGPRGEIAADPEASRAPEAQAPVVRLVPTGRPPPSAPGSAPGSAQAGASPVSAPRELERLSLSDELGAGRSTSSSVPEAQRLPLFPVEVGTTLSAQAPAHTAIRSSPTVSSVPPVPSPPPFPEHGAGLSFGHLFAGAEERQAAELVEGHLGGGDARAAVLACDVAMSRMLASVGAAVGSENAPKDAAVAAYLLGLEGPRYAAFRQLVRAARRSDVLTLPAAYDAYLCVLEAARLREAARGAR